MKQFVKVRLKYFEDLWGYKRYLWIFVSTIFHCNNGCFGLLFYPCFLLLMVLCSTINLKRRNHKFHFGSGSENFSSNFLLIKFMQFLTTKTNIFNFMKSFDNIKKDTGGRNWNIIFHFPRKSKQLEPISFCKMFIFCPDLVNIVLCAWGRYPWMGPDNHKLILRYILVEHSLQDMDIRDQKT